MATDQGGKRGPQSSRGNATGGPDRFRRPDRVDDGLGSLAEVQVGPLVDDLVLAIVGHRDELAADLVAENSHGPSLCAQQRAVWPGGS